MTKYTVFLLLAIIMVSGGGAGAANSSNAAEKARARKLFAQGSAFFDAGDMQKSLEKFRGAYELLPSWKLLYNIGQCEAALRHYGKAIEEFEKYLGAGGDDIPVSRLDEVLAEIDRLKRLVGNIHIDGPDGYSLYLNDEFVGRLPLTNNLVVNIGVVHHVIVKDQTGEVVRVFDVTVSGGETVQLEVASPTRDDDEPPLPVSPLSVEQPNDSSEQPDDPSSETAAPDVSDEPPSDEVPASRVSSSIVSPPPSGNDNRRVKPYFFVSSLAVTLVAGGVTVGLVSAVAAKWEEAENSFQADPWGYDTSRTQTISSIQKASYVTGTIAAVALVSTIIAIPVTYRKRESAVAQQRMRITPWMSALDAGISMEGTF